MKKYKSKIGLGIVLFIVIVMSYTSALMIINQAWPGIIINIIVAGFVVYFFKTTYYIINDRNLIIKSGFLINMTIKIDNIKKIKETNNMLSSPAASLDRIVIYYNNTDSVMVSPRDKANFIDQLTAINQKIEIVKKKVKH